MAVLCCLYSRILYVHTVSQALPDVECLQQIPFDEGRAGALRRPGLPGSHLAPIDALCGLLRSPPDQISRAPSGAEAHRCAAKLRRWLLRLSNTCKTSLQAVL